MTTNPFTPQDAERLRAALKQKESGETADEIAFEIKALAAVPALLDLLDALLPVAVAANQYCESNLLPPGTSRLSTEQKEAWLNASKRMERAVENLRSSPHAIWLKQGR